MPKLHELLAAEKTPNGAWNQLYEDTLKKFKNPGHFYEGHSSSLKMIEETEANKVIEAQAREEKPVTTTVYETLQFALDIFANAEDLQYQKNKTNQKAVGTVMWKGHEFLPDVPVDSLLGLEARLTRLRGLYAEIPTIDAAKYWKMAEDMGMRIRETTYPEEATKTEKQVVPVTLKEATKEHPAQVQAVGKDVVVGRITRIKRSGAATALQKAEAIKQIDELLVEIKKARMRANETVVEPGAIGLKLVNLLLEPLKEQG